MGYDAIIQVKSNVLVTHKYVDGNWTFISAEQTDFNTTLIEVADDYSKIIADAWIRRLPSRKEFTDQKDLFPKSLQTRDIELHWFNFTGSFQQNRERSSLAKTKLPEYAG